MAHVRELAQQAHGLEFKAPIPPKRKKIEIIWMNEILPTKLL
jgi:hypothetical protein